MTAVAWWSPAADIVTVLVATGTAVIALLRRSDGFRRLLLTRAIRQRMRRTPSQWWRTIRAGDGAITHHGRGAPSLVGPSYREPIYSPLMRALDGDRILPVDILSQMLAAPGYAELSDGPKALAAALEPVFRSAAAPHNHGLLARILYPEDIAEVQRIATDLADHLRLFCESSDVAVGGLTASVHDPRPADALGTKVRGSLAQFATALSGAVVLVDSVETRSRYVDDVLVWHRRSFRRNSGDGESGSGARRSDTYETEHSHGPCEHARFVGDRRLGDFDRRVLTLRGARIASSTTQGRVRFILETSESCYLATELGDGLATLDPVEAPAPVGCKHLRPTPGPMPGLTLRADLAPPPDDHTGEPEGSAANAGSRYLGVSRPDPDRGPVLLVATYVSIIASTGELVLVRRTSRVRHGHATISASAGGVIEPDGDGASGDVDARGMPSPLAAVLRETAEEIGIDLPPEAPKPVAVFLANVRNISGAPEASTPERRAGRGQLVATVLYLCRLEASVDEIVERVRHGDPALGGFEVDEPVVLGASNDGAGGSAGSSKAFSARMADAAREHAPWLDQHGLLSCLYAAAVVDGPDAAQAQFRRAFAEAPWWALGGGQGGQTRPRIVRDPRELMPELQLLAQDGTLEDLVPAWRPAWQGLPDSLRLAGEHLAPDHGAGSTASST